MLLLFLLFFLQQADLQDRDLVVDELVPWAYTVDAEVWKMREGREERGGEERGEGGERGGRREGGRREGREVRERERMRGRGEGEGAGEEVEERS